jgi:hypothetical protein
MGLGSAKGHTRRILVIVGVWVTLAASVPPVTLPPKSNGHGPPAGAGVGHKVG